MSIYSAPEEYDLKVLGEACKEPNWDFDMVVVWQDKNGNLFWAHDSGCSCPSPFEDYHSIGSLTPLRADSIGELERFLAEKQQSSYASYPATECQKLLRLVRANLSDTIQPS